MENNEIIEFIKHNQENFQANFLLTKPKNKIKSHKQHSTG